MTDENETKRFLSKIEFLAQAKQVRDFEPIADMMRSLNERTAIYLEFMASAFMEETGLPATRIKLVQSFKLDGFETVTEWRFVETTPFSRDIYVAALEERIAQLEMELIRAHEGRTER
jgi:hypothetical protein